MHEKLYGELHKDTNHSAHTQDSGENSFSFSATGRVSQIGR
jgi:hypothetical protein